MAFGKPIGMGPHGWTQGPVAWLRCADRGSLSRQTDPPGHSLAGRAPARKRQRNVHRRLIGETARFWRRLGLRLPAVAGDPAGNLFVSFSGSAATLNPSAEAILIPVVGSVTAVVVGQGLGPYDTATNPNDIWVASEMAASATNSCFWGTAIARLTLAPPTVSTMTPSMGSMRGGTTVTISGADFKVGGTTVSFSGTPLAPASVTVDSPQQIRVVTPPHSGCGSVPVVATTANGSSTPATFAYAGWPCAASPGTGGGFRSRILPPKVR